jgi:hypothetical protein
MFRLTAREQETLLFVEKILFRFGKIIREVHRLVRIKTEYDSGLNGPFYLCWWIFKYSYGGFTGAVRIKGCLHVVIVSSLVGPLY